MPFSPKQNKLFRAAEHNPQIAKEHGLSHDTAKRLAHEGVKKAAPANTKRGMINR